MTDRPGAIVEVEWVDSTGHGAWHSPDQARELLSKIACRSVGYLLHDEPEGIVITQGAGGVGEYLDSDGDPACRHREADPPQSFREGEPDE